VILAGAARRSRAAGLLAAVLLGLIVIVAVAAPLVAPRSPTAQDLDARFLPPPGGSGLGTDDLGRDVLSRIIYGVRPALLVGTVSVAIALALGLVFGLAAALGGRSLDSVLMLLMDSLLSFPTVLLAITVVSVLGYGLTQVMVAIGLVYSPVFARLVRAETLAVRSEGFVESSAALGTPVLLVVTRHILPNIAGKIVVQCAATFSLAIVVEASLAYLGLGTQPPEPSWGLMLKDARAHLAAAPWLAVYPGLALAVTVLVVNVLGDTLSERLNPKL
jgi:peptide/nickel transport system permease protein